MGYLEKCYVYYKGKLKMKNFKRFSLTMLIAPMLFVGCVSEQTASILPEIETEKIVTLEHNQTISETYIQKGYEELASITIDEPLSLEEEEEEIATTPTLTFKYTWEELTQGHREPVATPSLKEIEEVLSYRHRYRDKHRKAIPTTIKKQLTAQTLNLEDRWEELTKEDEILETAKNFLGTKYVWAANGPSAFDCSGFTKYVFKQNGITLPRYSGSQARMGEKIKFSELQKGDLVFFDTKKKFKHKVNHVGIYIGDNKFIHASSANKKVVITSFSKKKFYKNKFLYARRVINNDENIALNTTQKESLFN